MALLRFFTQLTLASSALAIPLDSRHDHNSKSIKWGPCDFENLGTRPIKCGTLDVPLDYTNGTSKEKLTLSLIKSSPPTKTATKKKSILFNFGGPGFGSVGTLNQLADLLHIMSGATHDLVAFDPRGTAQTLTFSCFASPTERTLATYRLPIHAAEDYDGSLADSYANMQAFSNICEEYNKGNKNPEFLGTAFVVRDMLSIVDALKEDGLLRFWGLSYGSLLGATAAAMFPDRMDRILLDGVVNAPNYYHHHGIDIDQLLGADAAAREIFAQCLRAGPSQCALAALNATTVAELEDTLLATAARYDAAPVAPGTTVISGRTVLELLYVTAKYPFDIAAATTHLANFVTGTNLTAAADYYAAQMGGVAMGQDDALYGIKCSDTFPRSEGVEDLMADYEHMLGTTTLFRKMASIVTQCGEWPFVARERYDGPWEGLKTKTPVLLVGNTWDPATAMENARVMGRAFEGAVVLEQRGFGHATISQFSSCTAQTITAYFVEGKMPEDGTVCEVNTELFKTPKA